MTGRSSLDARTMWLAVAGLVVLRLVFAALIPLSFDEAYYWLWSKALAPGYYDHPPMVALVIRAGTMLAGDTQLGVRLVSVLLALPATWAVWRAAQILYRDDRVAALAALYLNLTLMVAGGTIIVTPDAPLLVGSAFVLLALAKVHQTGRGVWWLAVGLAVGLSLVSKYTALFFGASILLWLLLAPGQMRWLWTPWPYLGGIIAFLSFAPVLLWNARHEWVSLVKQLGRAGVDGGGFDITHVATLVAGQFGLATPAIFILGVLGTWAIARRATAVRGADVLVSAMIWPLALYFLWHSLHAKVQDNWLMPVYPAFVIAAAIAALGVSWGIRAEPHVRRSQSAAVPVALAIFLIVAGQAATGWMVPGIPDPTGKKLGGGWPDVAAAVERQRAASGATTVVTSAYATTGWLAFYLPRTVPVVQLNERIRWINSPPIDPRQLDGPLLYVEPDGDWSYATELRKAYRSVDEVAKIARARAGPVIDRYRVLLLKDRFADPLAR